MLGRPEQQPALAHPNGYPTHGSPNGQPIAPNWFCYTWSAPTRRAGPCPNTRGIGLGADTRFSTQNNITEDLSLNLRWDVSERVGLNFDMQHIDSDGRQLRQQHEQQDHRRPRSRLSGGKPKFSSAARPASA